MNSHPYGLAKQLYRTSYSPAIDNNRPSSLNNPNFSQYVRPPIVQLRPESTGTALLISTNNLTNSQALKTDKKIKVQTSDYYPEPLKLDEIVKQIQSKIDEISKKVTKNTEDIKTIKNNSKNDTHYQLTFTSELERINKRQETIQKECIQKINELRAQILQGTNKLQKFQGDQWEKINLRFQEKRLIKIRNLLEDRVKQETAKIKLIIENEINKISNQLRSELSQETKKAPIKSLLKYPFRSTKITYNEFLKSDKIKDSSRVSTKQSCQSPRSSKMLMNNEQVYYIDKEGFLLDEDNYYLLDKDERMIRLTSAMIEQMRKEGLLQND